MTLDHSKVISLLDTLVSAAMARLSIVMVFLVGMMAATVTAGEDYSDGDLSVRTRYGGGYNRPNSFGGFYSPQYGGGSYGGGSYGGGQYGSVPVQQPNYYGGASYGGNSPYGFQPSYYGGSTYPGSAGSYGPNYGAGNYGYVGYRANKN